MQIHQSAAHSSGRRIGIFRLSLNQLESVLLGNLLCCCANLRGVTCSLCRLSGVEPDSALVLEYQRGTGHVVLHGIGVTLNLEALGSLAGLQGCVGTCGWALQLLQPWEPRSCLLSNLGLPQQLHPSVATGSITSSMTAMGALSPAGTDLDDAGVNHRGALPLPEQ